MTSNTCFINIGFEQRGCSYTGRVMNKKYRLYFRIFLSKTTLSIDKIDQNRGNKIQKEKSGDLEVQTTDMTHSTVQKSSATIRYVDLSVL